MLMKARGTGGLMSVGREAEGTASLETVDERASGDGRRLRAGCIGAGDAVLRQGRLGAGGWSKEEAQDVASLRLG